MNNMNGSDGELVVLHKKHSKKKTYAFIKVLMICSFTFAILISAAQHFIFADSGSVYRGDLLECSDSGYVSASFKFGSFPQTEITSANDSGAYSYLSSSGITDGFTKTYGGNTYLRQDDKDGGIHYYKFEPIEWEILRIDSDKVLAITKYAIDAQSLDTYSSDPYHWDGTYNGEWYHTDENGRHAYPSLRLYLNSYDTTLAGYKDTVHWSGSCDYSTLTYTPNPSAKFRDRGFYEKAFSNSEKAYILADDNELKDPSLDGIYSYNDKVRAVTYQEINFSGQLATKYWCTSDAYRGIYTSRFGLATDYMKSMDYYSTPTFYGCEKTNLYGTYDWAISRKKNDFYGNDNYIFYNHGILPSNTDTTVHGIRPMITLSNSAFTNIKIKMNAGTYLDGWGFINWYKNGNIDNDHKTDTFETTIGEVKNYKARVGLLNNSWIEDGIEYTPWHTTNLNGQNHGYIYYGSFPKNEIIKSSNLALWNYLNNLSDDAFPDGEMTVYDGKKYLRQDKDDGKRFYEVEPIKWSILKKLNGNLLLVSEACLESRSWDTQTNTSVYWDGTGGSSSGEKKSYPMLRLYLNSYDTTTKYEYIMDDERTSYSELKYSPNQFEKFHDKGFLEKAFNNSEQLRIKPDHVETLNSLSTSEIPCNDKIRLLGYYDVFSFGYSIFEEYDQYGIGIEYGFFSLPAKKGLKSNRMGFATDYSSLLYSEELNNSYDGYSTVMRKSEKWWTLTRTGAKAYYIRNDGSIYADNNYSYDPVNLKYGIRPVISLDVSGLAKVSGDGSLDNPYSFEPKILVTCDDINGEANLDWYPTGATAELTANTVSGNTVLGWYDGDTLISNENTYAYTVGRVDKELTAKVNVTKEGALNASNGAKETVLLMLSDSRYMSVIDSSDTTENVSDMVSKMRKPAMNELADLIVERRTSNPYESLSDVKTDIKLLADGLNLIVGGSGSNKTITIENYDSKLHYVLQKKTESKTYTDVGDFTSDTYPITLSGSSETYRAVVICDSIEYIYSKDVTIASSLKLSYDYKGGTGNPAYKELLLNEEIGALPSPTKTGYTFDGWFNDDETFESPVNTSEKLQADKIIYAKWTPITYKVKYKGNGNTSGTMSEDTFTYDVSKTLKTNSYERIYKVTFNANGGLSEKEYLESSYELSGWNTEADGTGEDFDKDASVLNLRSTQNDEVVLYAQWSPAAITLPEATNTGYTFAGWYKDDALTNRAGGANFDYSPIDNETLYAKWTPINVTNVLIYDTCGGTDGPSSQTYSPAYPNTQSVFTLSETKPQLTGYIFDWWYTKAEDGQRLGDSITVNDNGSLSGITKTIYAHYKGIDVTNKIIFDDNGGENGPGTITDTTTYPNTQSTFNSPGKNPEKTGWGFKGWFTDPVAGDEVTFPCSVGTDNSLAGDSITVYAHYEDGRYANWLHYDLNGGSNGPADVKVDVTYSNSTCQFTIDSLTIPVKSGYEFTGWYTKETGGDIKEGTITFGEPNTSHDQTLNLYAHYSAKHYTNTLKYDANGGDNAPTDATLDAPYPHTVSSFTLSKNIPTKTGYTFDGWYTDSIGGSKVESTYDVGTMNHADNQEATLYAHWKINEYKIDINLDGGNVTTPNRVKYNVESETFTLENPNKKGYTFAGWTGTGVDVPQLTVTVSKGSIGNLEFMANWTPNTEVNFLVNYYLMKDDKTGYEKKESIVKQAPFDSDVTCVSLAKAFEGYTFEGGKADVATDVKPDVFDNKVTILQNGTTEINLYYSKNQTSGGGGGSSGGGGSTKTKIVEVIKEVEKEPEKEPVKVRTEYTSYVNGYDDGEFKPWRYVTRAEFAKIIATISDDYALKDPSEYTSYVSRYKDVRDNFWNTPYIGYVISNDSMNGYPDGLFKPESNITRAEVCKVLVEIFDIKTEDGENKFANEIKNQWFEEPVDKLVKAGYINGYKDGTFGASRNITRAELVALINRIREDTLDENQIENLEKEFESMYKDVRKKDWFYSDVLAASVSHPVKQESLTDIIIDDAKVASNLLKNFFK